MEVSIFLPGVVNSVTPLVNFENDLGLKFTSAKWYLDWSDDFTTNTAQFLHNHGTIPEVTWQPQINGQGVSNTAVINGSYDAYINKFAQDVKAQGFPVRISLAPEMNSDWSPWGMDKNGNNAENHKLFWRYVVDKFRAQGTNNVQWIWAPNIHYGGEKYAAFRDLYPGDGYVTYVGLDGYNWGASQSWSAWQSFPEVFDASYRDLTSLTGKPILIMETASTEAGGNKAQWISQMFDNLKTRYPRIAGFTWFNINKETDWRIESSAASKTAFMSGVKNFSANSQANNQIASTNNSRTAKRPSSGIAALTSTPTPTAPPKPSLQPEPPNWIHEVKGTSTENNSPLASSFSLAQVVISALIALSFAVMALFITKNPRFAPESQIIKPTWQKRSVDSIT